METEATAASSTTTEAAKKEDDSSIKQEEKEEIIMDTESESAASSYTGEPVEMPLFKYARLVGSLPHDHPVRLPADSSPATVKKGLSVASTCSSMAQVTLEPPTASVPLTADGSGRQQQQQQQPFGSGDMAGTNSAAAASSSSATKTHNSHHDEDEIMEHAHHGAPGGRSTYHVVAVGFANGKVHLIDARTGAAIIATEHLRVREGGDAASSAKKVAPAPAIVNLSFDSSGTCLAAMALNGECAVFELNYISVKEQLSKKKLQAENQDMFSAWLGSFAQQQQQQQQQQSANSDRDGKQKSRPSASGATTNLTAQLPVTVSRFNYPRDSHSTPTCIALDPSYKRRREKALLVGFADGRLILTKRGLLFNRRSDSLIYQGTASSAMDRNSRGSVMYNEGIEAITWRGALVAWADGAGIKLFDVESMTRIANVERPKGARASLYPHVSRFTPTLLFERSNSLLFVWGDCVMSMAIQENVPTAKQQQQQKIAGGSTYMNAGGNSGSRTSAMVKRRTVKSTMAWELDIVACGVVPLDKDHLAVLGIVIPDDYDEASKEPNIVELQVISRQRGTVTSADALPLIRNPSFFPAKGGEVASGYRLLSSYALPRMDDSVEAELEGANQDDDDDGFETALFAQQSEQEKKKAAFQDSHLKWTLRNVMYTEDAEEEGEQAIDGTNKVNGEETKDHEEGMTRNDEDAEETNSVDSDDYTILLRPTKQSSSRNMEAASMSHAIPPTMVIVSLSDVVLVRTRDVDDAIQFAKTSGKHAVALRRALEHRQRLRRHDLNRLINDYLSALLRLVPAEKGAEKKLTIRRIKCAARVMPALLAGKELMWKKYIEEFCKIPGALFVLREHIPVRDPKLPPAVYDKILLTMLNEAEEMDLAETSPPDNYPRLRENARLQFLNALRAWGPSAAIQERIKLYESSITRCRQPGLTNQPDGNIAIRHALLEQEQKDLHTRKYQSAVGYLHFDEKPIAKASAVEKRKSTTFSYNDSLFTVPALVTTISSKISFANDEEESEESPLDDETSPIKVTNSLIAMEALAELCIMQKKYSDALQIYLAVGALHITPSLKEVEERAVQTAMSTKAKVLKPEQNTAPRIRPFDHVVSLIENHNLHRYLLVDGFSPISSSRHAIICLIQLLGLESCGRLLIGNCVMPLSGKSSRKQGKKFLDGQTTLPIDLVAEQLQSRPKLLLWYLHQIFLYKPEVYVKLPRTVVTPKAITDLHRSHLELYVLYTKDKREKKPTFADAVSSGAPKKETPLMSFLRAALPHGGARLVDVRRLLEVHRAGQRKALLSDPPPPKDPPVAFPHLFAKELAFVIEQAGSYISEEDALYVLELYVEGENSLFSAVDFAERTTSHSPVLWQALVSFCLKKTKKIRQKPSAKGETKTKRKVDGKLFGMLLESAASCGADLAKLVSQIPQGMDIEGLRPRLVAAVGDYRLKLKIHEASSEMILKDKIALLRELTHRARRGVRVVRNDTEADLGLIADMEKKARQEVAKAHSSKRRASVLGQGKLLPQHEERRSLSVVVPLR